MKFFKIRITGGEMNTLEFWSKIMTVEAVEKAKTVAREVGLDPRIIFADLVSIPKELEEVFKQTKNAMELGDKDLMTKTADAAFDLKERLQIMALAYEMWLKMQREKVDVCGKQLKQVIRLHNEVNMSCVMLKQYRSGK